MKLSLFRWNGCGESQSRSRFSGWLKFVLNWPIRELRCTDRKNESVMSLVMSRKSIFIDTNFKMVMPMTSTANGKVFQHSLCLWLQSPAGIACS